MRLELSEPGEGKWSMRLETKAGDRSSRLSGHVKKFWPSVEGVDLLAQSTVKDNRVWNIVASRKYSDSLI